MKRSCQLLVEEAPHVTASARMLELAQRLRLNLTNTFAGHAELLADFPQRVIGVHAGAEACIYGLKIEARKTDRL